MGSEKKVEELGFDLNNLKRRRIIYFGYTNFLIQGVIVLITYLFFAKMRGNCDLHAIGLLHIDIQVFCDCTNYFIIIISKRESPKI